MIRTLVKVFLFSSFLAPLPSQSLSFPGGSFLGQTIPITWQGKPAFIILSPGYLFAYTRNSNYLGGFGKPQMECTFEIVAGFFQDSRTCAPGSPVIISRNDHPFGNRLGVINPSGSFTWYGSILLSSTSSYPLERMVPWFHSYCDYGCYGKCKSTFDGPEFSALVVVIRNT